MKKLLLVLAFGLTAGYFYGFSDAQDHRLNVFTRIVRQIGGNNRGRYNNDVDARMERLER